VFDLRRFKTKKQHKNFEGKKPLSQLRNLFGSQISRMELPIPKDNENTRTPKEKKRY